MSERIFPTRPLAVAALALLALGVVATAAAIAPVAQPADAQPSAAAPPDENATDRSPLEDEFLVPVPEEGDPYFEAAAADGSWVSYTNPRDEYRDPYIGGASGKICVTLRNADGEVVAGESVPDTAVTIPTGETLSWHSEADPIRVEFPLTENYDRPLDADQFGTSPDVPQGDGYLDSHCVEFHGPSENATINYGEASVEGEHADRIDVVGYVQQENVAGWDTDVDPLADAEPYQQVGGWTNRPDASHGQAVVVLQLDPPEDAPEDGDNESDGEGERDGGDGTDPSDDADPGAGENESDGGNGTDPGVGENETDPENGGDENETDAAESDDESLPGFGVGVALVGLTLVALGRARR